MNANYKESMTYYTKACSIELKSIEARLGYANALYAASEFSLLKTVYEEILKIDPNHSITNYRMGLIYYYAKDYTTALTYFKKVIALYPFDYDTLLMMGWTHYALGNAAEAKLYFNKVLLYNPGDTSATEGLNLLK
jgi:tetratricopeptide (TPR) repeat protein